MVTGDINMANQPPTNDLGEVIEISVANGFSKARAVLLDRPYMIVEHYKNYIGSDKIKNDAGEELDVDGEYAIIFGNFIDRVGKFLSEAELKTFQIVLESIPTRPGIIRKQDPTVFLVKQMGTAFGFIDGNGGRNAGSPGDFLVAVPSRHDYRIFSEPFFKLNFKLLGE